MNFFDRFKQTVLEFLSGEHSAASSKVLHITGVLFLVISIVLTVQILQLQQELRQRAGGPQCQANEGADCGNNGKSCCNGMMCVPKQNGNGGKCQTINTPPTSTPTPPTYNSPPIPTSGGGGSNQESGYATPTPESGGSSAIGGVDSTPTPVSCGSNGCGWSPRPEGEKSTTEAPPTAVCTMSFNGPKQLLGTRLTPTSIRFNWWPTPGGADKQMLMYGLASGNPQWGLVNIAGNQGQIIIDHLPANKTIWAQIRAYRGNCYEDTGWVSVGSRFQAKNAPVVLNPTVTVVPSIITAQAALTITPTIIPGAPSDNLFMSINYSDISLLLLLLIFLIIFLLPLFKRRRRKKEKHS